MSHLDRPGKKHLVIFRDYDGVRIAYAWLTTEEQIKLQIQKVVNR